MAVVPLWGKKRRLSDKRSSQALERLLENLDDAEREQQIGELVDMIRKDASLLKSLRAVAARESKAAEEATLPRGIRTLADVPGKPREGLAGHAVEAGLEPLCECFGRR